MMGCAASRSRPLCTHHIGSSDIVTARRDHWLRYHEYMTNDDRLTRHINLCKRMYLRLLEDGDWPWPDSQNPEDLVESEDTNDNI